MKPAILFSFLLLSITPGIAHEFWLLPQVFSYQVGQKVYLRFQVGEDYTGENWQGNRDKVNMLRATSNNYQIDLVPVMGTASGDSVRLDTIIYPGNYTITYYGKNSYIELEAKKFNAYLEDEGLLEALRFRTLAGQDTTTGRENYQRCAKTLIRIKSRMGKSDYLKTSFYVAPTGLPLDFVPLDNPYNLKQPGMIAFNVYFQNKLLRSGKVWLWQKLNGKTKKTLIDIESGVAKAMIEPAGTWMISLVKMIQDPVKGMGYWQSYWGSLTWGY
jgi:hypothetical protein